MQIFFIGGCQIDTISLIFAGAVLHLQAGDPYSYMVIALHAMLLCGEHL